MITPIDRYTVSREASNDIVYDMDTKLKVNLETFVAMYYAEKQLNLNLTAQLEMLRTALNRAGLQFME